MTTMLYPAVARAAYEATRRLAEKKRKLIPTIWILPNEPLLRTVKTEFAGRTPGPGGFIPDAKIRSARAPRPPAESQFRWSGEIPGNRVAPQCGLYLSMQSGALSAELQNYSHGLSTHEYGSNK